MRHFVIVGILIILFSVLLYVGLSNAELLPEAASVQAIPIDWMWNVQVIAMCFLFSLIFVPMLYSLFVFRRRKGDTSDGTHVEGNTTLELLWSTVPLVVVVIFSVLGAQNLSDTIRRNPSASVVKVTGIQWSWRFEYPADPVSGVAVITEELHLVVDKPVLLQMTSTDVIHSFWVPEFRVKQDLVPGRITELSITPTVEGGFKVRCAELCGTSHAFMQNAVVISTQDEFDAWFATELKKARELAATPEGLGQLLVSQNGCGACHSINGAAGIGPTWGGLFGSEVELTDGTTVIADEAFIRESIEHPQAQIVKGFESQQMPQYTFTSDEIDALIAYIKTLQ
jgi:cytochrome c oxidase subunit 2